MAMNTMETNHTKLINKINEDIKLFENIYPITEEMKETFDGVGRLVMLDRYAFKDTEHLTTDVGDLVLLTVKEDPTYPARGIGTIQTLDRETGHVTVCVEEAYRGSMEGTEAQTGIVKTSLSKIDKPLELFYEQIAKRNARGLSEGEQDPIKREKMEKEFFHELSTKNFIPAGRVLYGAGSGKEVTYFNCYVMPFVPDSRGGLAEYRKEVMEIMSRGGGVGTNGSTLRPRDVLAKGVNGKSSGSVSWLNDLSTLTHLVSQGGTRRGAQMVMLADSHPDIIEFIISKMQNPRILRYLIENTSDATIRQQATDKLKFTPLTQQERELHEAVVRYKDMPGQGGFPTEVLKGSELKLREGGTYGVHNPDFMTGANISVTITDDFMQAVEQDQMWALRYPDIENYTEEEMAYYNQEWHNVGDVREWEKMGYKVRTFREIRAKDLWELITICATYSAEPGIFFIDNANNATNAQAYGQRVVATNPCGEQPLTKYAVCNLSAVNLANMVNKETSEVDYSQLKQTVRTGVRMQDNVIDATPYFLEENRKQALGERRIGLGVMGLGDLLIYTKHRYGSREGNALIDKIFETIAVTAYETSIELAKEKGSFPFLIGNTEEETRQLRQNFINSGFMKRMPQHIRDGVVEHGIRNSHLLTVAPTGSTGTMANVATGLEPYFAFKYFRSGRLGKFIEVQADIVKEYLEANPDADPDNLPDWFVSSMELTPEEHVDVQTTIQRWVDSSISKTVNAPKGTTPAEVARIYGRLYKGGAKGGTVYVDGSRDTQVLTLKAEMSSEDPETDMLEEIKESNRKVKQGIKDRLGENDEDGNVYGVEAGNTCPVCRKGTVEDIGGCNTCSNCQMQLKCGL